MARDRKIEGDETTHYRSQRKKRGRGKAKMQPPLTPMIDVTFQLLLFFLLTFTFRQAEGQIIGTLPAKDEKKEAGPVDPIMIQLSLVRDDRGMPTGCFYDVSGVGVSIKSPKELQEKLEAKKTALGEGSEKKTPVLINPLADVPWEYVTEAFNSAVKVGYKKVGFAYE